MRLYILILSGTVTPHRIRDSPTRRLVRPIISNTGNHHCFKQLTNSWEKKEWWPA